LPSEEIAEPNPTEPAAKPSEEDQGPKVTIIDGRRVVVLGGDTSESERKPTEVQYVEEEEEEELPTAKPLSPQPILNESK
jgi:hypothetical protein